MSDVNEAKVDKGRSDYGKASIRNYRRSGPGHGDPGMFDPSGKRGKTIDKRREEHKARRGVKGAKVPAYKVESAAGYSMGGEIKKGIKRHKDAVKKKKERSGKAVPYAMLAQEYVPEEGYDHMRDRALEKGTWKEPERKNPPRKPMTKKELDKQAKNSQKALDIVKGNIRKKYGKGAIMGEENLSELKNSTLLSYSQKATNDLAFKGDGKKKARKRATGIKTATNKLAMRATDPDGSLGYNKNPKNEEVQVEAKVDLKTPEHKRATVRDKRYGNPHGSHELGGGIRKDRRADHEARRGVKEDVHSGQGEKVQARTKKYMDKKGQKGAPGLDAMKARTAEHKAKRGVKEPVKEGTKYGLYKGDGKPKGAMAAFTKKKDDKKKPNPYGKRAKLKMLIKGFAEKQRSKAGVTSEGLKQARKNIGMDPNKPSCWDGYKAKGTKKKGGKEVPNCVKEGNKTWKKFLEEGNRTARQLSKSKSQTTGNISADRGDDEKKNRSSRQGLEKDLKKKGIGYSKGVGEYKYKKDGKEGTKKEVSYQTTPAKGMSKRRFGKVMRRLGRKHGQESVITKKAGKPAHLHDTQSKKADKSFALGKSKPGKNPSKEGETSGTKVRSGKLPSKTKGAMHYGN